MLMVRRNGVVYKISGAGVLENEGVEKDRGLVGGGSTFGGNDRCNLEEEASTKFSFSSTFWVGSGL